MSDADLAALATLPGGEVRSEWQEHTASCDYCGSRLRFLLAAIHDDLNPQERALVKQLEAVNKKGVAPPSAARRVSAWAWVAAAAVTALAGVAIWLNRSNPVEQAEQLLAQAYTEQRQFEWRVPGAPWAQTDLKLDAGRQRSVSLDTANAMLRNPSLPVSAAVLALRGRAEILDFREEAALPLLLEADRQTPSNVSLLTDLAVARALHADKVNESADYSAAIDYATRALAIDPAYAPALFNRALAFERLHIVEKAIADWEKLLSVEKDAGWTGEVRQRLEALKKKEMTAPR